jgi:hypothetical protein
LGIVLLNARYFMSQAQEQSSQSKSERLENWIAICREHGRILELRRRADENFGEPKVGRQEEEPWKVGKPGL